MGRVVGSSYASSDNDLEADGCGTSLSEADTALGTVASGFFRRQPGHQARYDTDY